MVSTSLLSNDEVLSSGLKLIPQSGLHWENFAKAFSEGYWMALGITTLVTSLSVVLKLLFSITMGYAFSYKKWFGKNIIWWSLIVLMMIPEVALIAGQYRLMSQANLNIGWGSVIAMFLPFVASIFSAYMFRTSFENIPDRIKEAAISDGANEFNYFAKIALPMISPTTWTVVILTAFAAWNAYMWPQLLISGDPDAKYVLSTWLFQTGKETISGTDITILYQNIRMAAAILVMLPMLIVYFIFRTRIMRAISKQGSGVKG